MRSRHTLLSLAALGLLLAGCSTSATTEPGVHGSAACAAIVEYDGQRYLGHGGLDRVPGTTGRTEKGVAPGCDDTFDGDVPEDREVVVEQLEDVPLDVAFLVDGSVYVREGRELPDETRAWFVPPSCEEAGSFEVAGAWLGVQGGPEPRFDGDIRPPYRLEVSIEDGPAAYVDTTVEIHANEQTEPLLTTKDVKQALWSPGTLTAEVHCEDGRFVADGLRTSG